MTSHTNNFTSKMTAFISSRGFFAGILIVLVLQAAWIALSGHYPMAFDENFHLGIISLYAHHLSPFWSSHPSGADAFGAVSRDPSYLYQYLMSFPYRLISVFTNNQMTQVLLLRFINIGLFVAGLPLYRRLLLKTGASRAVVHACLAIFILIPIVPLLTAQINYDNLLLPLTALTLLLTVDFGQELNRHKRINGTLLLAVMSSSLLTSLVKYAFLPILLVIAGYIIIKVWQTYPSFKEFWLSLRQGLTLMTRRTRWLLLVLLVLSLGLFAQRYGVNVLRYHKPIPECNKVLSVKQCSAYPPWNRDYVLAQSKHDSGGTDSPLVFTADWFYGMWLRTFFAVDGPASNFSTRGPLILPGIGAIVFASIAVFATIIYGLRLLRVYNRHVLWLFVGVIGGYVSVLWLGGYQSFLQVGQAEAINGRYLLPVMPLILLLLALGVNEMLRNHRTVKLSFATVAVLCLLWGGGALTYILRSSDSWYWQNQVVYDANHAVQHVLGPVTPGYYNLTEFMGKN